METIVKDNVIKFEVSHKILNENQHGFVPGKSTCSQLLEALYDWTLGLDTGDIYDVVTIDFRMAFDVILMTSLCISLLQWVYVNNLCTVLHHSCPVENNVFV